MNPMDTSEGTQPAEASWDFFLSYSSTDQKWAEWVAWQLEEAGYRVLFQAWDFVPGSHWTTRIGDGIISTRRTLAILSQAYLDSVYGQAEWEAAYRADPRGLRRKLIPIRVENCDCPGLLGGIVSFDIFDCAADDARQRILDAIVAAQDGRAKPYAAPGFPGQASSAAPPPAWSLTPPQKPPQTSAPRFPRWALPGGLTFMGLRQILKYMERKAEQFEREAK
jgi:TIR domain